MGCRPEKARDLQQSRLKAYRKKKSPKLECEFGAMKKKIHNNYRRNVLGRGGRDSFSMAIHLEF